jgi:DNA-binding response OmpR family regulator
MSDRARVLVVDDQAPNRKLLADLLSTQGYAIETAQSGEEALHKIERSPPDLVLLDVVMPGMNGYEVCSRLRGSSATSVLPVVMVTALDPAEERIKGLQAGADDFLTKPINAPELLARVKSLLRIKAFHDTVQQQAAELAMLNADLEKRVAEQLAELQRLAQLKRFFPPHLAERIAAGDVDDPLATHRREVTVVILDLRGFTAFADTSEPEEVLSLLRRYHQEMGRLIQTHGGTLEQFSTRFMLIVFNDPVVVQDPALTAVRMALAMRERFAELVGPWRKRGHDIALGIGIASGYATIGAIGDDARQAYGVIGRATNLAEQLSTAAAADEILVSAPVHEQIEALVQARPAQGVRLSGFAHPMPVYAATGLKSAAAEPDVQAAPLAIYTLGQFALLRDGQPLTFSRKVQKRPLDLLKVLVAHGGVRTDTAPLLEALWPEAEGDAAKVSFDSNLHRLRKLMDLDDVLHLSEGRLSLDEKRCWVDVWAFEALVSRIERATRLPSPASDELGELARELLRLYRGHFLEQETHDSWAVAARDRLKAKFLRAVTILGAGLEQCGEWRQTAALYSRALELDNLAEGLYRRLMICYRELGEVAEALQVYRRCRDMLSIVLGTVPSAETEAVRATLREAGEAAR